MNLLYKYSWRASTQSSITVYRLFYHGYMPLYEGHRQGWSSCALPEFASSARKHLIACAPRGNWFKVNRIPVALCTFPGRISFCRMSTVKSAQTSRSVQPTVSSLRIQKRPLIRLHLDGAALRKLNRKNCDQCFKGGVKKKKREKKKQSLGLYPGLRHCYRYRPN